MGEDNRVNEMNVGLRAGRVGGGGGGGGGPKSPLLPPVLGIMY